MASPSIQGQNVPTDRDRKVLWYLRRQVQGPSPFRGQDRHHQSIPARLIAGCDPRHSEQHAPPPAGVGTQSGTAAVVGAQSPRPREGDTEGWSVSLTQSLQGRAVEWGHPGFWGLS